MIGFPFTKDELLHVPLGAVAALLFIGAGAIPWGLGYVATAALFLYLREVIQNQSRNHLPIWRGWRLDWWHTREWLVPSVLIFGGWAIVTLIRLV